MAYVIKKIGGLQPLCLYFLNQKSDLAKIAKYQKMDIYGSSQAMKLVQEIMGNEFPAAL